MINITSSQNPNESQVPIRNAQQSFSTSLESTVVTIDTTDHVRPPDDLRMEQYFGLSHSNQSSHRNNEQPPSYDEVNDFNAPPPSYDSLFGRVREVRKTSSGVIDFIKKLFLYLLGKIGMMIMLGLTIVAPVTMLVIGSIYFSDCPVEPYIPVYLIVGGACGLLKQILALKVRSESSRQAEMEVPDSSCTASVQSLLNSFLICWFITGCYWVYRAYEPDYDDPERGDQYCNYVLYSFAFWLLTSTYVFAGIVVLLLCLLSLALIGRES